MTQSALTEVLEDILEHLRNELQVNVESACLPGRTATGDYYPKPGTCDEIQHPYVARPLDLVRRLEAEIGRFEDHENPQWLDDLIAGKWSLREEARDKERAE